MFQQNSVENQPFFTIDFAPLSEGSNAVSLRPGSLAKSSSNRPAGHSVNRPLESPDPQSVLTNSIHSFTKNTKNDSQSKRSFGRSSNTRKAEFNQFIGGHENIMIHWLWNQILDTGSPSHSPFLFPLCLFGAAGVAKSSLGKLFSGVLSGKYSISSKPLLSFSGKDFCRSFRQAEETNSVAKWRSAFEIKPVLFLDDVHHICGHQRAEKELKEILDRRVDAGFPSLFTSNQSPSLIPFSPALGSRFQSGLSVEVKKPGNTAKIEIIKRIFANQGISIEQEQATQLSESFANNIFSVGQIALRWMLEGGGEHFKPENASKPFQELLLQDQSNSQSPSDFIKDTAHYFDLRIKDLKGNSRRNGCVKARSIAMWICRDQLTLSYKKIGSLFGGRDHSTVINACRKIQLAIDSGDKVVLCCVDHVLKNS